MLDRVRRHENLVLLLDYDGTLVPFAPIPEQAAPDSELLELLAGLSRRPNTLVQIVSGRDRDTLERWFSGLSIGLHAEHGLWSRLSPHDPWRLGHDVPLYWKDCVLPTMEQFSRCTPGSLIEHKFGSIAWHYRRVDPEFGENRAEELCRRLADVAKDFPVHILPGDKVIEVKWRSVDKGQIVKWFVSETQPPLLLALGDDRTDEDLFAALPDVGIAVHVGPNPSCAAYRIDGVGDARQLLRSLLE